MRLTLVYLLPAQTPDQARRGGRRRHRWESLGTTPVQRFASSYARFAPGIEHRLLVVVNGHGDSTESHLDALGDTRFDTTVLPTPVTDLDAYRRVLPLIATDFVCFLNANASPQADQWLRTLLTAATMPGIGIAGCTGSYERVVPRAPRLWRRWPEFPNPHLRSNAFVSSRAVLESLSWPRVRNKLTALRFESGPRSLTRQVLGRGLGVVVVGNDTRSYEPHLWFESATFRSGEQARLLVADNRTRDWESADGPTRAALTALAWGVRPGEAAERVRQEIPERMGRG